MTPTNDRAHLRALITDNSLWHTWPLCALSRPNDIPGTGIPMRQRGVMRARIVDTLTIYLVPLYLVAELHPDEFDAYPLRLRYDSVDELLDDGWRVD